MTITSLRYPAQAEKDTSGDKIIAQAMTEAPPRRARPLGHSARPLHHDGSHMMHAEAFEEFAKKKN